MSSIDQPVPQGGHRGTRAVQRMVEFAPSTGGLALWVHHHDLPADAHPAEHSAVVSTDGDCLYYAAGFDALPVAAQAGLVAHEVLHIALRHPQRLVDLQGLLGEVDARLFNICADAIVNSTLNHLSWLQLPPAAVTIDKLLAAALAVTQSVEKSLLEWDVEGLYRAIDDRRLASQRGRRGSRRGSDGGPAADAATRATPQTGVREDGPRAAAARALGARTPQDLRPPATPQEAPEMQAQAAREWSERLIRAHAGDGGFSMLRSLLADLPRTRTPWEQVLRTQLARALTPRVAVSWSRPSRSYLANQGRAGPRFNLAGVALPRRRMPWEPGHSGVQAVPRLVVVVDVSSSIDDNLLERFAREIEALTRRLEAALVLVIGDDRVQRVLHLEPVALKPGRFDWQSIEFKGGGGTDFTPLLEEADRHRPDIGVVLTDLDGPARFRPRWPVIWAVPETCAPIEAPFGRRLVLR